MTLIYPSLIDIILFYLIIILYTKIKMFDPNYKNYQDNRQLTLYDALKESYKPIKDQENYYKQHGYILDKSL